MLTIDRQSLKPMLTPFVGSVEVAQNASEENCILLAQLLIN
jgi:hypothetical protein